MADFIRLDIGFEGGQVLAVRVTDGRVREAPQGRSTRARAGTS